MQRELEDQTVSLSQSGWPNWGRPASIFLPLEWVCVWGGVEVTEAGVKPPGLRIHLPWSSHNPLPPPLLGTELFVHKSFPLVSSGF